MRRGMVVQADSIKTRVESACGVCHQRLKAEYHKLLSTFAFNFNLRYYAVGVADCDSDKVRRCRLTPG
jgi:hypothetical protein